MQGLFIKMYLSPVVEAFNYRCAKRHNKQPHAAKQIYAEYYAYQHNQRMYAYILAYYPRFDYVSYYRYYYVHHAEPYAAPDPATGCIC